MKLELWSTCISLRMMLPICSFVCNCSESFGFYSHNNWLECFKMSNKLVSKNYQNTNPHITAQRRSKGWPLLSEGGGGAAGKSVCQNRAKASCDGNVMRLIHVPTGQPTSARSTLASPPGPFTPTPDANKEDQDTLFILRLMNYRSPFCHFVCFSC